TGRGGRGDRPRASRCPDLTRSGHRSRADSPHRPPLLVSGLTVARVVGSVRLIRRQWGLVARLPLSFYGLRIIPRVLPRGASGLLLSPSAVGPTLACSVS